MTWGVAPAPAIHLVEDLIMISRVFHANLELFMFAFLWYLAIAFERGLFCSAHILTLPSAHTNAFVHFLYPSFCKPNLCLRMRGRLYNRDYTSLAGELHLTYLYRVPAYCKMSGYRQYTLLTLGRPSRFHENCSPLAMIQCNTWTPSRRPTKAAQTTV